MINLSMCSSAATAAVCHVVNIFKHAEVLISCIQTLTSVNKYKIHIHVKTIKKQLAYLQNTFNTLKA